MLFLPNAFASAKFCYLENTVAFKFLSSFGITDSKINSLSQWYLAQSIRKKKTCSAQLFKVINVKNCRKELYLHYVMTNPRTGSGIQCSILPGSTYTVTFGLVGTVV